MAAPALAADTTTGWEPTVTPGDLDVDTSASLSRGDTMNFADCADIRRKKFTWSKKCGGTIVYKYEYREPSVLVEVSCRFGQSRLMKQGVAGDMIGKAAFGALKAGEVGSDKCLEAKTAKQDNNWYFEARSFGITIVDRATAAKSGGGKKLKAYLQGSGLCDLLVEGIPDISSLSQDMIDGLTDKLKGMTFTPTSAEDVGERLDTANALVCSPWTAGLAQIANTLPIGPVPIFVSDIARPCWTVKNAGDIKGDVGSVINTSAMTADGGVSAGMLCGSSSILGDVFPDMAGQLKSQASKATGGLADEACVGSWGTRAPSVGFSPNHIRPVAAAMVGYRAYLQTVYADPSRKSGIEPAVFDQDYPFINTGMANGMFKSLNPFGKASHGAKGSGCYNPGTMDYRFYTAGESLIPDFSQIIGDATQDLVNTVKGSKSRTDNGDYVYTYWKRLRCNIPLKCPFKAWKESK